MEKISLSEKIADFTTQFSLEQVPLEVQQYAKLMIADAMGCAIAAHDLDNTIAVRKTVKDFGSKSQSTIWGTKDKVGIADAILVNASMIHGMDFDDTHVGGIVHPSAGVVSTAISVGEAVNASGKEVLEAIICGYEIIIRLALAAQGGFHDIGFHGTAIVAPFAAVCVAGKLFHSPKNVIMNALGICGSQAAGLQEFLHDGAAVKKLHPGWGGHSAIYALKLAEYGLTGPNKVFEGEFGLYQTHIGNINGIEKAFSNLGKKWLTQEISVKLYPCCAMTHSFVDCTSYLLSNEAFSLHDIEKIECRIAKRYYSIVCVPDEAKKRPTTEYGMKFSLPYIVAMTLYKHKFSPAEIDGKFVNDSQATELMDKVDCVEDDKVDNVGHFPGWVKITLKNGQTYFKGQRFEQGAKENPISREAIIEKFKNNAQIKLSKQHALELLNTIQNIENIRMDTLLNSLNSWNE